MKHVEHIADLKPHQYYWSVRVDNSDLQAITLFDIVPVGNIEGKGRAWTPSESSYYGNSSVDQLILWFSECTVFEISEDQARATIAVWT